MEDAATYSFQSVFQTNADFMQKLMSLATMATARSTFMRSNHPQA